MNQIYACRKGREIPFPGTTRMTTVTKAPDTGGRGMLAKLLMGVFVFLVLGAVQSFGQIITYSANGTYTVPLGVTQIRVDITGGGGAGAGSVGGSGVAGGGGGGGSFGRYICNVTPGQVINVTVGTGGTGVLGAAGNPGNPSSVSGGTCTFSQAGGAGGQITLGGTGGGAGAGGVTNNAGGDGGDGESDVAGATAAGGGGGGAATLAAPGTAGQVGAADIPGTGGSVGGGTGGTVGNNGNVGTLPGGGGGGAGTSAVVGTDRTGGNGANGVVVITSLIAAAPACFPSPSAGTYGPVCQTSPSFCLTGTPTGGVFSSVTAAAAITPDATCPNAPNATGYRFNPALATPGCHTITYTYVDPNPGAPCSFTANTTILVYPTPPVITAPANTCNAALATPGNVTDFSAQGFTTQYSVDGAAFSNTYNAPSTPGCHTIKIRYRNTAACGAVAANTDPPAGCAESNTVSAVVFPPTAASLTTNGNQCNAPIQITGTGMPDVAGFNERYSITPPGGAAGAFVDQATANTQLTNTPGCWTITGRYELAAACGATPAGATSGVAGCTPITVNNVVFPPTPASISTNGNQCNAAVQITGTGMPDVAGFNERYSITPPGGAAGAFVDQATANTQLTNTPGCWTITGRYELAAACGGTPAGSTGTGACQPLTVNNVVFPATPAIANMTNTCATALTLQQIANVNGFNRTYEVITPAGTGAGTWLTAANAQTALNAATPGCWTVRGRYELAAACGPTPAGATGTGACAPSANSNGVVFPQPVAPTVPSTCSPTPFTPTMPVVAGFNQQFSNDGGATWYSGPSPVSNSGCYTVIGRYVLAAACGPTPANDPGPCPNSGSTNVIIYPQAPVISSPVTTCAPNQFVLPNVPNQSPDFITQWSVQPTGNAPVWAFNPVMPTTPGVYDVRARYVNAAVCGTIPALTAGPACSQTNTVTAQINSVPTVTQLPSPVVCCNTNVVTPAFTTTAAQAPAGGTVTYNWTNSDPSIGLAAAGTGNIPNFTAVCASTTKVATIDVTATHTNGGTSCTGPVMTFTITVRAQVTGVITVPANATICAGQNGSANVNLTGTPQFNGVFNILNNTTATTTTLNWTSNAVGGPQAINIPAASIPNATNSPITYTISWNSLTDASACPSTTSGTTNITVMPLPQVVVNAPADVCPGSNITWTINPAAGNTVPYTYNYTVTATPAMVGFPVTGSNVPSSTTSQTVTTAACPVGQNVTYTISVTPVAIAAPNCNGSTQTDAVTANDVNNPVFASFPNQTFDRCNAAGIAAARAASPTATNGGCPAGSATITGGTETFTPSCGYTTTAGYQAGETGVISRTWTATDPCGNVTTLTQTITITDNTAPTWTTAPGALNQTVDYCDNAALTAAQALAPTFTDGCAYPAPHAGIAPVKVSGIFAQGACPTQGTITNTWTVTDPCGNVSTTFTQVITVVDTQGPSITGANAQTLNIGAGANCQVSLPNYINGTGGIAPNAPLTPLTITDCATPGAFPPPQPIVWNQAGGPNTAVQSPAPGTTIIGAGGQVVPVTITATDACGNTSTFTINVTLLDQTPPVARCHNATVFLSSTVNGGTVTITPIQIDGNNSVGAPAGNGLPPSGTPAGSGLGQGSNPSTDNCSPVPTPPLSLTFAGGFTSRTYTCANLGANPITLTVTDAAGNATNCNATITVVDNTRPTFTCPGPQTISRNANCTAVLPDFATSLGLVATDNCTPSGSIVWTQTPAAGTIYGAGVTTATVTLTATDGSGNVSSPVCNITVNFVDNTAPIITCPATINATTGPGNTNCNVAVTYTLPTATDNCQGPGFPGAVPVTLVSGPASGGQFFVGTTAVTYRATDAAGNSSTCTFNVVVTDNTLPTVVCVANQTVNAGAGCVYTYNSGNLWNPAPFDNCLLAAQPFTWSINGGIPFSAPNLNGRVFPLGNNTVSVTATDASGNVSLACTFQVNVVDAAVPAFTSCPSSFTVTTAAPNGLSGCRANVTLPAPTTTQNCTTVQEWFITSVTSGTPSSSGIGAFPTSYPMNVGITQVQYRLSDANGNSTTCTYNVTVQNVVAGAISGTATAAQNAATTSTITFTGSGGTANYCFTYDVSVNGGPFGAPQTVCTTGGQNVVTVAQSNAVVGTYQYRLLSVTDASGCAGTITAPNTATVTVVTGTPDLTSSQFFTTTQIAPGGIIDEVIVIRNVGTAPTSGPITFSITNYTALTGLTVTQRAAGSTATIGIDTYTASAGWTFNPATGQVTSNNVIPAGGSQTIIMRITRGTGGSAGANGSVTQTTTIAPGTGGGEAPTTNNTISNTLLKN